METSNASIGLFIYKKEKYENLEKTFKGSKCPFTSWQVLSKGWKFFFV